MYFGGQDAFMVKRLTDWLLAIFVNEYQRLDDHSVRIKYGFLEAWISIVGNIILSVVKIILGLMLNSVSLLADAVHTVSDVITSVIVLVSFAVAKQQPDKEHPFGHGRVEFMATFAIAILLVLVGVEFGRTSFQRLIHGNNVTGNLVAGLIMAFSGLVKELMALVSLDLGHRIDSSSLIADAWHHRSDAIASALVAVAMVFAYYGYVWVDSVLGLGVSALIIHTAWELGSTAASSLIGEAPSKDLVDNITSLAMSTPKVLDTYDVVVHDYGVIKAVSLRIIVGSDMTLAAAHKVAGLVEEKIATTGIGGSVVVHVDPDNTNDVEQCPSLSSTTPAVN